MTTQGFRLGPTLTDRIISVVKRVDDMPYRYGNASVPVRFEDDGGGGGGGAACRLCKTTCAFLKNTVATLDVWEDGEPPNESISSGVTIENVVNKYGDIEADKFVSVSRHGNGRWYVVAADCE